MSNPDIAKKEKVDDTFSFPNPLNNNGSHLKIDTDECSGFQIDGIPVVFTDFLMIAEGISKEDAFEYYKILRSGVKPPDLIKIKKCGETI